MKTKIYILLLKLKNNFLKFKLNYSNIKIKVYIVFLRLKDNFLSLSLKIIISLLNFLSLIFITIRF